MRIFRFSLLPLLFCILLCPTQKAFAIGDRAVYVEVQNEYQNSVLQRAGKEIDQPRRKLKVDFSSVEVPDSTAAFNQVWHFSPTCQDLTGKLLVLFLGFIYGVRDLPIIRAQNQTFCDVYDLLGVCGESTTLCPREGRFEILTRFAGKCYSTHYARARSGTAIRLSRILPRRRFL